jgi:hypothetical protein
MSWPCQEGLSLQVQLKTQARKGKNAIELADEVKDHKCNWKPETAMGGLLLPRDTPPQLPHGARWWEAIVATPLLLLHPMT